MRILMACPAPPGSRKGNRVTAVRWARILRGLGHAVSIRRDVGPGDFDLLIALHARRSHQTIAEFRRRWPGRCVIVALTGTDLYHDLRHSGKAQQSLQWAQFLVLLQPEGVRELPKAVRKKARVIFQSARPTPGTRSRSRGVFRVCVLGHLRSEKDPFRAALALGHIPIQVPIQVIQAGQSLAPEMADRARRLMQKDHRYKWVGEVPRWRARRLLAGSHLLVLSSRLEGGANVISEAVVDGVPVLASRISGSIGLLGTGYPGYFPVGNTRKLATLLCRAATDEVFYAQLKRWCDGRIHLFAPELEAAGWKSLCDEAANYNP